MNSDPYSTVGDAHEFGALLTNAAWYDVARLERINRHETNHPDHIQALLNDDQWQETINLIHAAPAMRQALRRILHCPEAEFVHEIARAAIEPACTTVPDEHHERRTTNHEPSCPPSPSASAPFPSASTTGRCT